MSYKFCSTNIRPMPLEVSSEVFADEWHKCWEDKESDLTTLFLMVKPLLLHWERMFTIPTYNKDIQYIALCKYLAPNDPDEAITKLAQWVEWAENTTSVLEELEFIFMRRIRSMGYYPKFAKPISVEYVIVTDFRYAVNAAIRSVLSIAVHEIDYAKNSCISPGLLIEYDLPDYLLLKNLSFSKWESYLFYLVLEGYSSYEISRITRIPRETYYYEEKQIWQCLKARLSDN